MPSGTCSRRSGCADTIRSLLVASVTPLWPGLVKGVPKSNRTNALRERRTQPANAIALAAARPRPQSGRLLWHGKGAAGIPGWHASHLIIAIVAGRQAAARTPASCRSTERGRVSATDYGRTLKRAQEH